MPRPKSKETIERMTLKLPKSVAQYFRKAFPHGQRSQFVTDRLLEHQLNKNIQEKEEALKRHRHQ